MKCNRILKFVIEHLKKLIFKIQLKALKKLQFVYFEHLKKFTHFQLRFVNLKSKKIEIRVF